MTNWTAFISVFVVIFGALAYYWLKSVHTLRRVKEDANEEDTD